ncbi:MAG: MFS transporter [Anaerolineales bacterium]|jgi:MFS family permease
MANLLSSRASLLRSLALACLLVSFPFGTLTFLLPLYGRRLGASAVQIGTLFSALSLVPVIVRPLLGPALDRFGRKPFLLIGLSGYSLAMGLFAVSNSIILLAIARLIQGTGQAFLWIAAFTIVADIARETGRGLDFGIIDEAVNRGALIGTSIGLFAYFALQSAGLTERTAWMLIFSVYAIPAMLSLVFTWLKVNETLPESDSHAIRSKPLSSQLIVLMGVVAITSISSSMIWPLLMIFLQDQLNATIGALALAYFPAALINSILPTHAGKLTDHIGRKRPMIAGLWIGALTSFLIPNLASVLGLALLWGVENIGLTISFPAQRAFVADIAGRDVRGTSYGLYTFAHFLGAVIGPVLGGWMFDSISPSAPFYFNTFVLLIGSLLIIAFLHEPMIEQPAPAAQVRLR